MTSPAGERRAAGGETFLTVTGSCYADVDSGWNAAIGATPFQVIRRPTVDG